MGDEQDLMRQIARAGAAIHPSLTDRDIERLITGAARRSRRRRTRRKVFTGAVAGGLLLAVLGLISRPADLTPPAFVAQPAEVPAPAKPDQRVLRLTDGSTVVALDPATELDIALDTLERMEVVLGRGRGRFEITPRPARTFVVDAGEVKISVLGTRFTVERIADRVGLTVEQGTVRIEWGMGSESLTAGQSGWYPPLVGAFGGGDGPREAAKVSSSARAARRALALASPRGRSASPARAATETSGETESAERLLAAADKARLSGRPGQGVGLLRNLLRDYPGDPRAPLAAFTLGRILLMELAQPMEAAAAFADTRRLSPTGPLAEDALAREVEAFSQAGAAGQAKARALEYLRRYPDGRRVETVRMVAGIR